MWCISSSACDGVMLASILLLVDDCTLGGPPVCIGIGVRLPVIWLEPTDEPSCRITLRRHLARAFWNHTCNAINKLHTLISNMLQHQSNLINYSFAAFLLVVLAWRVQSSVPVVWGPSHLDSDLWQNTISSSVADGVWMKFAFAWSENVMRRHCHRILEIDCHHTIDPVMIEVSQCDEYLLKE